MTSTHRTLAGSWELCAIPATCELLFHVPDATPEQLQQVPLHLLLTLFEAFDPPSEIGDDGEKIWRDRFGSVSRDYDLPAVVSEEELRWYRRGMTHRSHGRPAAIFDNGDMLWYEHGQLHREGGLPAVFDVNGTREWWVKGQRHRDLEQGPAVIHEPGYESPTDLTWTWEKWEYGQIVDADVSAADPDPASRSNAYPA